MNISTVRQLLLRPGASDLVCVGLLIGISLAGVALEPGNRDFWLVAPAFAAIPLLCTGVLLLLPFRITTLVARAVHWVLILAFALGLALSAWLMVTILMAGMALVVGPPCALLVANSLFVLARDRSGLAAPVGAIPRAS